MAQTPKRRNGDKLVVKIIMPAFMSLIVMMLVGSFAYTKDVSDNQVDLQTQHQQFVTKDDLKELKKDVQRELDDVKDGQKEILKAIQEHSRKIGIDNES